MKRSTKADTSYYRSEPRRWYEPKMERSSGFFPKKPSPIRYRIEDSAHYEGKLEMPAERMTIYVVSTKELGDCWWSKDHPRSLPALVYRS